MNKYVLSLLLLLSLLLPMNVKASTTTYNDDVPYAFPIVPGTSEWENFISKEEMVAACQIPENKLKNMTTEALLQTVLNYPLITDYSAFDSDALACETMYSDFNGFRELFSRTNITTALLEQYSATTVVTRSELEYLSLLDDASIVMTVSPKEFFALDTMEYLLNCNEIINGEMSIADTLTYNQLQVAKSAEVNESTLQTFSVDLDDTVEVLAGEIETPAGEMIKTPRGSIVPYVVVKSPEYTTAERAETNAEYDSKYPRATRIGTATVKYNCHSYAWYLQSTSNPYWIKYSDIYRIDYSYVIYTGTPYSGVKVSYNTTSGENAHSAICTGNFPYTDIYEVRSKWGVHGLYLHLFNYCPYTSIDVDLYIRNPND